jgi:Family of unknown function (DUF6151)
VWLSNTENENEAPFPAPIDASKRGAGENAPRPRLYDRLYIPRGLRYARPTQRRLLHMPFDVPLRCRCGRVCGIANDVAPSVGFRLICYCKDCQAFARFLERSDVLDAAGGTDIFQMPPGRVRIPAIVTTRSDGSRPPVPIDRDQFDGAVRCIF